jgi:phosphomannomutase
MNGSGAISIRQDHHICGTFDANFAPRDIYRFGLYVGTLTGQSGARKIVVASDRRQLNRTHVHLAIGGLQGADCDVVFLGCAPYSMLNYACRVLEIPHALMMTSAEAEDGTIGFRLALGQSPVPSFELKEMFDASRSADFDGAGGNGRLTEVDLRHGYLRWLMHGTRPNGKPLSVLWDACNGAAADIVTSLATILPGRQVVINQGNLPPLAARDVESVLREMGEAVIAGGFDLGIAFSGDGTGLAMVDDHGQPVREWHRLRILSTRRGRQPIAGNGLLASRRKARSDIIKHALKVIRAISESGQSASALRLAAEESPLILGKGSVTPHLAGGGASPGFSARLERE